MRIRFALCSTTCVKHTCANTMSESRKHLGKGTGGTSFEKCLSQISQICGILFHWLFIIALKAKKELPVTTATANKFYLHFEFAPGLCLTGALQTQFDEGERHAACAFVWITKLDMIFLF